MKIDHFAMYVKDLEAARSFFMRYFGASANEMYHNPKTGLCSYFLSFEGGKRPLICRTVRIGAIGTGL